MSSPKLNASGVGEVDLARRAIAVDLEVGIEDAVQRRFELVEALQPCPKLVVPGHLVAGPRKDAIVGEYRRQVVEGQVVHHARVTERQIAQSRLVFAQVGHGIDRRPGRHRVLLRIFVGLLLIAER